MNLQPEEVCVTLMVAVTVKRHQPQTTMSAHALKLTSREGCTMVYFTVAHIFKCSCLSTSLSHSIVHVFVFLCCRWLLWIGIMWIVFSSITETLGVASRAIEHQQTSFGSIDFTWMNLER